jgi:SAM-dependent MidA family methyltransferase
VSALAALLREETRRSGPVPFHQFMRTALYHPELGYYRRARDPFGKSGDFYTAEQIQPVFGILVAARIRALFEEMGRPEDFTIVELGAGRGEMAEAFSEWRYVPVEVDAALPENFRGVVFSNEFFDALPVHAATVIDGTPRELCVGIEGDRFGWITGGRTPAEVEEFWREYCPAATIFEANLEALRWMERIAAALASGYVLTVDYGYTTKELARFPAGTLMSYHRHTAREDVLSDPGERDITAHVPFTALQEHGTRCGLRTEVFEPLSRMLLRAGEADQFACALRVGSPREEIERRLQLKSLLVGMGETFRTLLQKKVSTK